MRTSTPVILGGLISRFFFEQFMHSTSHVFYMLGRATLCVGTAVSVDTIEADLSGAEIVHRGIGVAPHTT
jgi:hypothetical protein